MQKGGVKMEKIVIFFMFKILVDIIILWECVQIKIASKIFFQYLDSLIIN